MMNRLTGMLCLAVAAVLLSGCYEAASDKPLMYKKGEYIGKKDEELSSEARNKLRSRMSIQGSGSL